MNAGDEYLKKASLNDEIENIHKQIGTELLISDIVDFFTIGELEKLIRFVKEENKIIGGTK